MSVSNEPGKYTTHKKLGIFGFPVQFMENVKSSRYSDIISWNWGI